MTFKKVLLVGLGSIGLKYLNILKESKIDVISKSRRYNLSSNNVAYVDLPTRNSYDLLIISSETKYHIDQLIEFHEYSDLILVEKPLTSDISSLQKLDLLNRKKISVFVSSPLKFFTNYREFRLLTENFSSSATLEIVCHSWLPNWRKDRDITSGYWSDQLQGGVVRDLVHEINYITSIWPNPEIHNSKIYFDHYGSGLNVDTKARFSFRYQTGLQVNFSFDYFSKFEERYALLKEEDNFLLWDIKNKFLILNEGSKHLKISETVHDPITSQISALQIRDPMLTSMNDAVQDVVIIDKILNFETSGTKNVTT